MADLTSTITITGIVGGKKIDHSHVWTIEDVYDVGTFDMDAPALSPSIGSGADGSETFKQDSPTYLFAANKSVAHSGLLHLTPTGAAKEMYLMLLPGQFVILGEHTNGTGLMNTSGSTTTTLLEIEKVQFDKIADIGKVIKGAALVAYQATT